VVEADGLRWLEADFLSKVVTIGKDKNSVPRTLCGRLVGMTRPHRSTAYHGTA
jgi:hypothetical protein